MDKRIAFIVLCNAFPADTHIVLSCPQERRGIFAQQFKDPNIEQRNISVFCRRFLHALAPVVSALDELCAALFAVDDTARYIADAEKHFVNGEDNAVNVVLAVAARAL